MTICGKEELFLFLYASNSFTNLRSFDVNNSFFFSLNHDNSFCFWTEIWTFSVESVHWWKCDGQAFQCVAHFYFFTFWFCFFATMIWAFIFHSVESSLSILQHVWQYGRFYHVPLVFHCAILIVLYFNNDLLLLQGRS